MDLSEFSLESLSDSERLRLMTIIRVGQIGLLRQLEENGLSDQAIDRVFLSLPSAVRQGQENTFSLGILDDVLKSVERRLDAAEKFPEIERLIDEAADETEAQSFAVLASGKGVGSAISTAVYAALVLLLIAKLNGAYDFKSGEGYIGLSPGVPAGVTEFVEGVGKAISDILKEEVTGVSHFGRRLIEVSLDEARSIRSGDSGALLSVMSGLVYQPLGIVVAGALTSRLRGANNIMTSALYAVPFSSIPDIDQLGPV